MRFEVNHRHHHTLDARALIYLSDLLYIGQYIMANSKEQLGLIKAVAAETKKFGPAINDFESRMTEALKKIPDVPSDVQTDIDEGVEILKGVFADAQAALADAADKVDENATTETPVPGPLDNENLPQ